MRSRPLGALIDDFRAHLGDRNLAPLTIRRYTYELRRLLRFIEREAPSALDVPGSIDKSLLVLFLRNGSVVPRPTAPATWNARVTALQSFFAYQLREGTIASDPSATLTYARVPEQSPSYLARHEYEQLLRAIETGASDHYRARDLAIAITLWNTGMRVGELVSLDLRQADFAAERFRNVRLKGRKVDDVHFNVEVTIAIRRWLVARTAYTRGIMQEAIFLSDRGRRLSVRAVEDLFKKYAKAAQLGKRVTPHTMRHSAATELIRQEVPMPVVADALHHRSMNTTRRYVHLVGAEVHAAIARLAGDESRSPTEPGRGRVRTR